MSLQARFLSVIIPIGRIIEVKGKDWWNNYLKENNEMLGITLWFDKYIFRDGSMSEDFVEEIIKFWEQQGLKAKKIVNKNEFWNDLCVVDSFSGPTLPCEWLKVKYITTKQGAKVVSHVSFYKDNNGEIIGPTKKYTEF